MAPFASPFTLLAAVVSLVTPTFAQLEQVDDSSKRYFIKYTTGSRDKCLRRLHRDTRIDDSSSATRMLFDFPTLSTFVLHVESSQELTALRSDPDIAEIVEDTERTTQVMHGSIKPFSPGKNLRNTQSPPQIVPYGVEMVQAPFAWQHGIRGKGVKVCVIDSGATLHEDLNQTSLNGAVVSSFWSQGDDEWVVDRLGHGTHVAGTIAALDNDIGVIGVAPEAEVFVVKFFADDTGFAYSSSLINAAYKCRDVGAKIISMSLGGPLPSPFEFFVFDKLLGENGILSFAAAGNSGTSRPSYPASYDGVTSVAAVDRNQKHAYFSQQHRRVDIAAPGVDILSLLPRGGCTECGTGGATSGYGTASGTSMATPHVAGVAALLWSFKPAATAEEIVRAMEQSATDLGDEGRDDVYGHGLVNVKEALTFLNGAPLVSMEEPGVAMQRVPSQPDQIVVDSPGSACPGTASASSIEPLVDCDDGFVAFDLTLTTDLYAAETSWVLVKTLDTSAPVLSASGFENTKTYEWHRCLPMDCYTFVIYDTEKNGICCEYGSGSYTIAYGGAEVANSNGEFGSRQASSMGFCSSPDLPIVNIGGSASERDPSEPDSTSDATAADSTPPPISQSTTPLSDPTPPPTVEPVTDAPGSNPSSSNEDCVEIALTLTTDSNPGDTSFRLLVILPGVTGEATQVIWDYSEFSENEAHEYMTCQDPSGCYEFTLLDSLGDGLCCAYGQGNFELSYNGVILESEGEFGEEIQRQFGEGCTAIERTVP